MSSRRCKKRSSLPLPPKVKSAKPKDEGWSDSEIHITMEFPSEDPKNTKVEAEKELVPVPEKENIVMEEEEPPPSSSSLSSPPRNVAAPIPIMTPSKREMRANARNQKLTEDAFNETLQELDNFRMKCSEMEETCLKYSELEGRMRECNQALVEAKIHLAELKKDHQNTLAKILTNHGHEMSEMRRMVRNAELKLKNAQAEADDATQKLAYDSLLFQNKERDYQMQLKTANSEKEMMTTANLQLESQVKDLEVKAEEALRGRENLLQNVKVMEREYQEKLENMATHYKKLETFMTEQINALRADNSELEHKLASLKKRRSQELADSEKAQEQSQETIKALKDSLIIFKGQNEQMIKELEKKQEFIAQIEGEKKKLESKLASAEKATTEVEGKMKELSDIKSSLEEDLKTANKKSAELVKAIKQKEDEIERLKKETMQIRFDNAKIIEDKNCAIRNLQHELALDKTETAKKMMEKERQITDYVQKLNHLLESRESATQEMKYLRESLRQKNTAYDALRLEHENLKARFDKLNQEVGGLINEVVNSKQDAIGLKENLEEAIQKSMFYKNRLDELTTLSTSTESENTSCEIFDKEVELAKLKSELAEKQKLIDTLQGEITAMRTPGSESKKRRYFDM